MNQKRPAELRAQRRNNSVTPDRYRIDKRAFVFALVLAPLLVALTTFWLFFISVFAVLVGAVPYLLFGTPILIYHLHRNYGRPIELAWRGAFVALVIALVFFIILELGLGDIAGIGAMVAGVSAIFGGIWAFVFGLLYNAMRQEDTKSPVGYGKELIEAFE